MNIEELRERLLEINTRCQELQTKAGAEKRDLTTDEGAELEALLNEFDHNKERLAQLTRFQEQTEELKGGQGRKTQPDAPGRNAAPEDDGGDDDVPAPAPAPAKKLSQAHPQQRRSGYVPAEIIKERKGGFRSLGEMALHVARACMDGGGVIDPRLQNLATATTYSNEGTGADGGFAVPPDFRAEVMQKVLGEDSLITRCDQINTPSNSFTMVVDETTPWQTTGGIQVAWDGEATAATQSKVALTEKTVKLNKVRALVPVTEELLEDAPAMDAYLRRKAPEKLAFAVSLAIYQGNGVGKPLGILNSPALVTVSKESSQIADSVVANNIVNMWSRLYGPCRSRAVWVINQDIEPYLNTMSMPGRDNTGNSVTGWGFPVYMPAGGLSQAPYGTLMGRPVVPTQVCETLGDLGDIAVIDFTQYLALLKSGVNPRVEVSMHLWFDQDIMAFKFVLRVGGMPWWGSAITPRDSSNTLSFAVALEAR